MLLDHISPIELAILRQVWQQFGSMDQWAIRGWTHNHCAEWVDPQRSSCAISFEKIAKAVGFKDEDAQAIAVKIESMQYLRGRFAS